MEQLHPGARWSFRFRAYSIAFVIGFFFNPARLFTDQRDPFQTILIGVIFALLVMFILGEIYARLAYKYWKFEFTERELKLERGIIFKTYKSIPYQRVQNVDIRRGILARLLGFSTVDTQTAGYSMGGRGMIAEGRLPAVATKRAEEIREFVMSRITKDQGL